MRDLDDTLTSDRDDLDWLVAQRPAPLAPHATRAAQLRAELTGAGPARATPPPFAAAGVKRRPLVQRRAFRLGLALSAGAAATAGVLASGSGSHRLLPVSGLSVQNAKAAPLARLTRRLLDAAQPSGDATLVIRKQAYPDSPEIDGADLYTDSGDYYYAPTEAGLPALVASHSTENDGTTDGEVRDIAAARNAFTGSIDDARHAMAIAGFDPNHVPTPISPGEDPGARAKLLASLPAAARAQLQQKFAQEAKNASQYPPASPQTIENGYIWDNSMDALLAGAGDPQVRAGVLHLLATIPQISVTQTTTDGQPTLTLTAALFEPTQYRESLIIDATTGVPMELIGGNQGQAPSVTVTYDISRVTAAQLPGS